MNDPGKFIYWQIRGRCGREAEELPLHHVLGKVYPKMPSLREECYLNAFGGPPLQGCGSNTLPIQQVPVKE